MNDTQTPTLDAVEEDGARERLNAAGDHFIAKGKATIAFGKALRNPRVSFSTVMARAREADMRLTFGIGDGVQTTVLSDGEAARSKRDANLLGALCVLADEVELEGVDPAFLETLTNSELGELARFLHERLRGETPKAPNFLPPDMLGAAVDHPE